MNEEILKTIKVLRRIYLWNKGRHLRRAALVWVIIDDLCYLLPKGIRPRFND